MINLFYLLFLRKLEERLAGNGQNLVLAASTIIPLISIFLGAGVYWGLNVFYQWVPMFLVPPTLLMSACFGLTSYMLMISSMVVSFASLYLAKDTDLLLVAPISTARMILHRLLEVTIFTIWMPILLIVPVLIAFGFIAEASIWYYLAAVPVTFLNFLIAILLGQLIIVIAMGILPIRILRNHYTFVAVLAIAAIIVAMRSLFALGGSVQSFESLVNLLSIVSLDKFRLSVFRLAADSLLLGSFRSFATIIFLSLGLLSVLVVSANFFYRRSYELFKEFESFPRQKRSRSIIGLSAISVVGSAIWEKEIKSTLRNPAQLLQILLISSIWLLYVSYLSNLQPIMLELSFNHANIVLAFLWIHFLINNFIFLTAVNRFVFTSLSAERESIWIYQTSPISEEELVQKKGIFWGFILVPIYISSVIYGGFSLYPQTSSAVLSTIINLCGCLSVITLGCVFGRRFANFGWNHFGELMTGSGSLIFLAFSIPILIFNSTLAAFFIGGVLGIVELNSTLLGLMFTSILSINIGAIIVARRISPLDEELEFESEVVRIDS